MDDFTTPLTVEQMYGDWDIEWEDAVAIADRSLDPRPRTSMYDTFGSFGIGASGYVLDIGARDAAQSLDLAERFGCRVLAVDPVQANVNAAVEDIATHKHGDLVNVKLGTINGIPAGDDTFDAIFSRDMMGHVADLAGALSECRRVLKDGGAMVIHDVFATPLLEPKESERLCADLAQVPERLDAELFERTAEESGFTIEATDRVASEWLETLLEGEDGEKHPTAGRPAPSREGSVRRGDGCYSVPCRAGQRSVDDLPHEPKARRPGLRDQGQVNLSSPT